MMVGPAVYPKVVQGLAGANVAVFLAELPVGSEAPGPLPVTDLVPSSFLRRTPY